MDHLPSHLYSTFAAAAIFCSSAPALAGPVEVVLKNPGFDAPALETPLGDPATTLASCSPDVGAVGMSASAYWTTYGNTMRTSISSWLVTHPSGPLSNLVATGGGQGGLVQVLRDTSGNLVPQGTITNVNRVSAWVYVIAGQASIQIGDGGSGGGTTGVSQFSHQWEYISGCGRLDMRNNEVVIYGTGPAVFYVEDASISNDVACSCLHSPAVTGEPLDGSCGSCERAICNLDPYCCTFAWDSICVAQTASAC